MLLIFQILYILVTKNYSKILIEQQLLRLMYYCQLVFLLIFLSYIQKMYLLFILLLLASSFSFVSSLISSLCHKPLDVTKQLSLYCNRLCICITISRSSALSTNVLLIFDMHDLDKALFLKISFLFLVLASLSPLKLILPFKAAYIHHRYSHISFILTLKLIASRW